MNKTILVSLAFVVVMISLVSATDYSFFAKTGTDTNITIGCFDNRSAPCASQDMCQLTIASPQGGLIYDNVTMNNQNTTTQHKPTRSPRT